MICYFNVFYVFFVFKRLKWIVVIICGKLYVFIILLNMGMIVLVVIDFIIFVIR